MPEYDAFLLLSFGGPEGPDDVMPFLENVTRGRGVPRERLAAVAEHYYARGGVSPINGQCRDMLAAISAAGLDLPMYWGNRNWRPFLEDTVRQMADDGVRRAVAFVTSAYSSYSACRQYLDDIDRAVAAVGAGAPRIDKIRPYFDHPGFIEPFAAATAEALAALPADVRDDARLVFTAHSVPVAMAAASGAGGSARSQNPRSYGARTPARADPGGRPPGPPGPPGGQYAAELSQAARLITERMGRDWASSDLVWQSRSGPPSVPWLEPDVCDHLRALAEDGVPAVVVVPVGFVSDHMEVVHDLDTEARSVAESLGMAFARAAAPGSSPLFARMVCDLVAEAQAGPPSGSAVGCPDDCCREGVHERACERISRHCASANAADERWRGGFMSEKTSADSGELLELAKAAAREAGELLASFTGQVSVADTKSSPTDVVTEMDHKAEDLIRSRILAARPGDAILGEEGGETGDAGGSGVRWVIDPLDGTVNYLYGLRDWAVSIAAEVSGEIVAGAVFVPRAGELFTASLGGGAWLTLTGVSPETTRPLTCGPGVPLDRALVATGFGYRKERRVVQGEVVAAMLPQVRDIRRAGSAAVDLCSVAAGRVDGYYERGLNYWDWAAGALIAGEAGAVVGGLGVPEAGASMIVAAGLHLYVPLCQALSALDPERDA